MASIPARRRTSLNQALLRAALMATLVPMLMLVALGLWQYRQDLGKVQRFTGQESLSSARVASTFLGFLVADTRYLLERIGRDEPLGVVTDRSLVDDDRSQLQTDGIEVTDPRGVVTISSIGQQGRDISNLSIFQEIRHGHSVAYSNVFYSRVLHENVVLMAVPYSHHGRFAGIVLARLNIKGLNELLAQHLDDPRLRYTFVVDGTGHVIFHYDPRLVESRADLGRIPPVVAALGGETGWMSYLDPYTHIEQISGFVRMPGTGWAVISTRKRAQDLLDINSRLREQLALALATGLLVGLGALWWGRRLSRPLAVMASSIREIPVPGSEQATTPLLEPVHVESAIAEYDTLVNAYNALVQELSRRFTEIVSLSEQAQASNRLKSEFLAKMSHELRTPLNSIIGFTQLVLTDEQISLPPETHQDLEIVLKSARHLLAIINDILDISKIEAGQSRLYIEAFDPCNVAATVADTLRPQAQEKGLTLTLECPADLAPVTLDQLKVQQILLNLVANAVKFTSEGSVRLSVAKKGLDRWTATVVDTGIGIAPEDQEMIFEEFRQVNASPTRQGGGTGLGLAIARKLARLLGGDLTLQSAPGQGSMFILELPRELQAPASEVTTSEVSISPATRELTMSDRPVVLVIDDDPLALHLATENLRGAPCVVLPVDSHQVGLQLAQRLRPAAIVLDIKLRRNDDWTMLRQLRTNPATSSVPVIVMSFADNRATALSQGAASFLAKPVTRDQLRHALEPYLMLKES